MPAGFGLRCNLGQSSEYEQSDTGDLDSMFHGNKRMSDFMYQNRYKKSTATMAPIIQYWVLNNADALAENSSPPWCRPQGEDYKPRVIDNDIDPPTRIKVSGTSRPSATPTTSRRKLCREVAPGLRPPAGLHPHLPRGKNNYRQLFFELERSA